MRVNTHAAPALPLSAEPPTRAVFPSADSATLQPTLPAPVSPLPVELVALLDQRVDRERIARAAIPDVDQQRSALEPELPRGAASRSRRSPRAPVTQPRPAGPGEQHRARIQMCAHAAAEAQSERDRAGACLPGGGRA